jgi:hypothetical protein
MRSERLLRWCGANWFALVAPSLVLTAWLVSRAAPWPAGGDMEVALLVDACVTLPVLYALCYGRSLPLWQLAVRCVGIACLGIYLLGYIVPPHAQVLLPSFGIARTIGLVLLLLIEVRLLIAALRLLFGSELSAEKLSAETGAPPLVAKLMILEARFWKAVWRFLRR